MIDVLNSMSLNKYHCYLQERRRLTTKEFEKALNLAEKMIFDNTILKEKVLKKIPSRLLEAVSYLSTWDELWILFSSPFLSVQRRIEMKMEEILSNRDNQELPAPLSGLTFRKKVWEGLTLVPDRMEELEEVVLLSKGPLALFLRARFELSKKDNTLLSQQTRLSGTKVKMLWERSLIVKAIKITLEKGVLKPYRGYRHVPGIGFSILSYIAPRPRVYTLHRNT